MSTPEQPPRFNTHGSQREHFETYKKDYHPELIDEDYEAVRAEIAEYYNVPPENRFFISDEQVNNRRTQRAFSVVMIDDGAHYYIDGRVPHALLLRTLKNTHHAPFDPEEEGFASVNGFMDPEGFSDNSMVQGKAKELNKSITWFVRYTVPSPKSPELPKSPIEIS